MGVGQRLYNGAQRRVIGEILDVAQSDDKAHVLRAFDLAALITPKRHRPALAVVRKSVEDEHPAYALARRVVRDFSPATRDRFIQSFILNSLLHGSQLRDSYRAEHGYAAPTTVLVSPTMRCNLACAGCYAAEYPSDRDMSRETLQRIVRQGNEMGVHLFTLLGGEPFLYPDLIDFCAENRESYFLVFSNGTLLDEATTGRLGRVGNVAPMLSIEGDRPTTDARRGRGIFDRQMAAMERLRAAGVPFGYSVTVTRSNWRQLIDDAFVDDLVERGAVIGWHFLYMPIGRDNDAAPMLLPEERNAFREGIERIRATKAVFPVDFWGDAPWVGGCIAGKHYLHITSEGWVEPCIFTHFATHNINDVSLEEAFDAPFFREIRRRQPFNHNLFLPCMLIDNPWQSREIVATTGARPTHPGADAYFTQLAGQLDEYARGVDDVYAPVWACSRWAEPAAVEASRSSQSLACVDG